MSVRRLALADGPGVPTDLAIGDFTSATQYTPNAAFFPFGSSYIDGVSLSELSSGMVVVGTAGGVPNRVAVFDGSGTLIQTWQPFISSFTGAVSVSWLDATDVAVGAGHGGSPLVRVYDPAAPTLLASFFAFDPAYTGGITVAGIDSTHLAVGTLGSTAAEVKIFDTVTQTASTDFLPFTAGFTGGLSLAEQRNGVLAVGVHSGAGPQVKIFDASQNVVADFFAFTPAFTGGVNVAWLDATHLAVSTASLASEVRIFDVSSTPTVVADAILSGSSGLTVASISNTVVTADLGGDGKADILWRAGDGSLIGWGMTGGVISSNGAFKQNGTVVAPNSTFSVVGLSDFSGDGKADVLWRSTSGELDLWTMNGSAISSSQVTYNGGLPRPDASFSVVGTGDFNGDGKSDILWRSTSGEVDLWSMNGGVITSPSQPTYNGSLVRPDSSFSVGAIGDFDGDGKSDILWRATFGELDLWSTNGGVITSTSQPAFNGVTVQPDASYSIAGVGDFNGDGKSDVLWRSSTGDVIAWLMNGTSSTSGPVTSNGKAVNIGSNWKVVEIGDFDGNGTSDVLWRSDDGALAEWLMNGTTITQPTAPTSNGAAIHPDASFSTQAKPTNFG